MIHGVQQAFLVLGGLTILSSVVFMELRKNDAAAISRHDSTHHDAHDHGAES
jgi:hypothetical protein